MKTIGFLSIATLATMIAAPDAVAQRGAQHLKSPGYPRALADSRKPKIEAVEPATVRKKQSRRVRLR